MTPKPLLAILIAAASIPAQAQAQSFEAASIKVNRSGNYGKPLMTTGRINFSGVTLKECVTVAYDVNGYQVVGPASLPSDRYDIVAKAEGPASNAELRGMLKTLLADRFKLKLHLETRELPAYRLIAAKNGPKLTRATTDQAGGYVLDAGSVVFHATSLAAFAEYLSRRGPVDRPVVDGTRIEGLFDFKLRLFEVRPDMPLDALKRAYFEWDQGSSIFTDIQEQLGLKLQPEKAPIDVVVIESVAKPSED